MATRKKRTNWFAVHAASEQRLPAFPSLKAAAYSLRRQRDRLLRSLYAAATKDDVRLGDRPEDLDRIAAWASEIVRSRRTKSIRMTLDELADALELHTNAASCRTCGMLWVVCRAHTDPDRYDLKIERGNGTWPAWGSWRQMSQSFWESMVNAPSPLRSQLSRDVEHAALLKFERVFPHRERLSPHLETRYEEIRLLERGDDPWSEQGIMNAWTRETGSNFPAYPALLAGDLKRCGSRMKSFLHRQISAMRDIHFLACVRALKPHAGVFEPVAPPDRVVIADPPIPKARGASNATTSISTPPQTPSRTRRSR
ncbi:MAG: hypothetical protein SFY96_08640 [Planctomycetota bacterium]|nr:hypothetical protein [Planctomycetota bacterium]